MTSTWWHKCQFQCKIIISIGVNSFALLKIISYFRDNTRIDYVKNGVRSIISEFGLTPSKHQPSPEAKEYSVERVTEGAIDSLIAQVKELMPDLKDDFIQVSGNVSMIKMFSSI